MQDRIALSGASMAIPDRRQGAEMPQLPAVAASLLAVGQLSLLLIVAMQQHVPLERLLRDTLAVAEEYPGCCHVYDGLVSNIGVLIWFGSAAVTGFSALILLSQEKDFREIVPLAAACAISTWLTLDDFFMLHESVLPHVGLPQSATLVIYVVLVAGYLVLAGRAILAPAPALAFLMLATLGASAGVDILADHELGAVSEWLHENPRLELLLDDGFKFLGIGFWFSLHLAAAMNALQVRPPARA